MAAPPASPSLPRQSAHVYRIGVVIGWGEGYQRGLLRGVKEFARTRPDWILRPMPHNPRTVDVLRQWQPDGVIVHSGNPRIQQLLGSLHRPMVGALVNDQFAPPRGEYYAQLVDMDHGQVGRLAAYHLLEQQFEHFGFVGVRGPAWSERRQAGFEGALAAAGRTVEAHHVQPSDEAQRGSQGLIPVDPTLTRWLMSLPRPVGIFAANDMWGVEVAEACALAGLKVPEEIAIVGADNDDLWCEMAQPELSSVAIPWERIGFQASACLAECLDHPDSARKPSMLVPPLEVVVRHSSDMVVTRDPDLSAALRFIRQHADQPFSVADLLRALPVERRRLERLFRRVVGRSPLAEIHRVKIEKAKQLLARTDWSVPQVASICGISPKEFARVFRKVAGVVPTEYRRLTRTTAPPSLNAAPANRQS